MCSLYFCFGPGLTGPRPILCFLCSQMFFFFLFLSGLNWNPPHPLLSPLTCALSFCSVLELSGTEPHPLLSLFSGTHPSFSEVHVLEWFWRPDSEQLLSLQRNRPYIASNVSLVCNVWVPAQLGLTHPLLFSALMRSLYFCFGAGLTRTGRTLCFICSHVLFVFVPVRVYMDPAHPLFSLLSYIFFV